MKHDMLNEVYRNNQERKDEIYEFFARDDVYEKVDRLTTRLRQGAGADDASIRMRHRDLTYVNQREASFQPDESARSGYAEYALTGALFYDPKKFAKNALVAAPTSRYDDYANGADLVAWAGNLSEPVAPLAIDATTTVFDKHLDSDYSAQNKQKLIRAKVANLKPNGERRDSRNLVGATSIKYYSEKTLDNNAPPVAAIHDTPRVTVSIDGFRLKELYQAQQGDAYERIPQNRDKAIAMNTGIRIESLAQIAYQLHAQNEYYNPRGQATESATPPDERTAAYATKVANLSNTYNNILIMALGNAIDKNTYKPIHFQTLDKHQATQFVLDETTQMFNARPYSEFAIAVMQRANYVAEKLKQNRGARIVATANQAAS